MNKKSGTSSEKYSNLGIIIPCYNEEHVIPDLIKTIECQIRHNCQFVFVDNNSSDNTNVLLDRLLNRSKIKHEVLCESQQGRLFAIEKGVKYFSRQKSVTHVMTYDADNAPWDNSMFNQLGTMTLNSNSYYVGPYTYTGFNDLPNFAKAYQAFADVLNKLMRKAFWFATGANAIIPINILDAYMSAPRSNTHIHRGKHGDIKVSLYCLLNNILPEYNQYGVNTSGRRILNSQKSFDAWCFYAKSLQQDYKNIVMQGNGQSPNIKDLRLDNIPLFFMRRAKKIVERNILVLLAYAQDNDLKLRMYEYLKAKCSNCNISRTDLSSALHDDYKYEALISYLCTIEKEFVKLACNTLYSRMVEIWQQYDSSSEIIESEDQSQCLLFSSQLL